MFRRKDKDKGETGQPPNYSSAPGLRLAALVGVMLPVVVLAANIVGTPEPDVLEGTPQADTINGKGGADTMMGLPGDDTYFVAQPDDEVLEAVGDGTDTIRSTISFQLPINVENLTLVGGAAIDGTGNGLDNRLTGNSASNVLSGRAGADRMFGLAGNDTYIVDEAGDVVNEAEDDGLDMVRSSVTHTLRNHVEDLILTGVATASGIGNNLPNSITGNSANNILNGLAGDDSLRGGGGDDRLIGGPGNDRLIGSGGRNAFQFDAPLDALTNADRILDFDPAKDVMRLIGEVFPALTTAGALPVAAFRAGVAANDASDRILYDPATGIVRYDADGTGPMASVRFATLVSAPAITSADFVVVDPVVTAVNFTRQIQPIFTQRCDHCHSGSSAPQGLRLDADNSYADLVNVDSNEVPSLKRVEPGDPDNSYLVQKVEGTAAVGGRMPLGGDRLSDADIDLIRQWISEGANEAQEPY
jgi:Ca2+-binding RTX toxin-like protein